MEDSTILNILDEELSNSIGGDGSTVIEDRKTALRYYLGKEPPPPLDADTHSSVTSTDVADSIEWIMPEVVKAFTQTNEVVTFDAINDGDEDQADLESDYTYGVIMKENDGFILFHTLIKDCLLEKNGVAKVFFDGTQDVKTESYTSLSKEQLQMLVSDPDVEIMTMTGEATVASKPDPNNPAQQPQVMPLKQAEAMVEQAQKQAQQQMKSLQMQMQKLQHMRKQAQQPQGPGAQPGPQGPGAQPQGSKPQPMVNPQQLQQKMQQIQQQVNQIMSQVPNIVEVNIDVKVKRTSDNSKVTVLPIPSNEFRISSSHNSVNPNGARFTAHVPTKTRGELIKAFPKFKADIQQLGATMVQADDDSTYRFTEQGEEIIDVETSDKSQDDIAVFECYLDIDIDDDGIGKYMQITALGENDSPTLIVEKTEVDCNPFVSATAIMMSHKYLGLSIFDRLKDIQDEKSQLRRSINDNIALINNKEYEVVTKNLVSIDDMFVSRPGALRRVKVANSIREIPTSPLPPDVYKMFEYLDTVRAGRSGVSPESPGQNHMIGAETAHGLERLMTKKEELVGLIVRVIAETAIKPLVIRVRELLIKHSDVIKNYKFRGQWKQFNPARWQQRSMVTVRVGTGTGSQDKQVAALTKLGEAQMAIKQDPTQSLVNEKGVFKLLDDLSKAAGLTGAREYILDPESPEGKKQKELAKKQQAENKKKQDEVDAAFAKSQMELAKAEQMKGKADLQTVQIKAQMEQQKAINEQNKVKLQGQIESANLQLQHEKQQNDLEIQAITQKLEAAKIEMARGKDKGELEHKYEELQFKYDELAAKMALEEDKLNQANAESSSDGKEEAE